MWTCSLLKQNARYSLQGRFWRVLAAQLLVGLATTLCSGLAMLFQSLDFLMLPAFSTDAASPLRTLVFAVTSIFITAPLSIGLDRFMMENRVGRPPLESILSVFKPPYMNLVVSQLLLGLQIFAGMFLIIPGIYWALTYCMVPYLLAENPYMTLARAKELSRAMTDGEKLHLIGLGLSFIGWYLLCLFTLGLGLLFVVPYIRATEAELYAALRAKVFAMGLTDASELGDFIRY